MRFGYAPWGHSEFIDMGIASAHVDLFSGNLMCEARMEGVSIYHNSLSGDNIWHPGVCHALRRARNMHIWTDGTGMEHCFPRANSADTDAAGFFFDGSNVRDESGGMLRFSKEGRLLAVKINGITREYTYTNDVLTSVSDPAGRLILGYDGSLVKVLARKSAMLLEYSGAQLSKVACDGVSAQFSYDKGAVALIKCGEDAAQFEYDRQGRVCRARREGKEAFAAEYSYLPGATVARDIHSCAEWTYHFDASGHLTAISQPGGALLKLASRPRSSLADTF